MATRKQKIKVSLFLIVCLTIMVVSTAVISGMYKEPGIYYWMEFNESILGLYEGGMVEYLGVPVGKIRDIYVTGNQVAHVEIVINPQKVTLHEGVQGQLVIYSIASGTMAVSLSGGNKNGEALPEYTQIPTKPSTIEAFSTQLSDILGDVSDISSSIKGQLAQLDESAVKDIVDQTQTLMSKGEVFVDDTSKLIRETTETVQDIRAHADKLVANLELRSEEASSLIKKLEQLVEISTTRAEQLDIETLQEQFSELLTQVTNAATQMDSTVASMDIVAQDIVHQAGNVEYSLRGTLVEFRDSLESIRIMINQIKEDPSSLIRGRGRIKENE
ncbi:MAG: MCE family protein [Candidatus Hydrogenedens sp.]|nr:MCE family protein [Candidatus Hydrogenedens sp.]